MSLFRRRPAAESRRLRPRLSLEALENRLTPAWFLMTSNLLDVTSAPIALTAPAPAPQEFKVELDGMVRLARGGAEQEASFQIEDVASLTLGPGQGETSFKVEFDEPIALTLAGAKETADISGDGVLSLKFEGAAEVASIHFEDVVKLKLEGATAEGDVTLHTEFSIAKLLPSVSLDEAASLNVAHGTGGGTGKIPSLKSAAFSDNWNSALTGPATDYHLEKRADLAFNDSTVLANTEQWHITPTAAAGAAAAPSLMLDGAESITLNFAKPDPVAEYKEQFAFAGDAASVTYDDPIYMNFGPATARQEEHLQATGDVTSLTSADDITLTPNDPTDLASDTQNIECATGNHVQLALDDTVQLQVDGFELTMHTQQTAETDDVIRIELDSLLSKPGPGPGG
jgi:hypothetical protein